MSMISWFRRPAKPAAAKPDGAGICPKCGRLLVGYVSLADGSAHALHGRGRYCYIAAPRRKAES